jgi:hypothetical protein
MTCLFYGFLVLVEAVILVFIGHFLYKALALSPNNLVSAQWRWTSEDSRDMWVDSAKTMITAAGIAAALVASFGLDTARASNLLLLRYAKVSAVCLVACVCSSMASILAISRGHEAAKARNVYEQRMKGNTAAITEGVLSYFSLSVTLILGFMALSSFFIGFVFLARIVWDF